MTRRQWIMIIAGLAAAAAAILWAFSPRPVMVETVEVGRGRFEQTIDEDGKTRVRERYTVSAPLLGTLQRIRLKAGDAVEKGDLLAVIAPASPALLDVRTARELQERVGAAEAGVARARAAVARAGSALSQSKADLERTRKLAEKGFVSPTQLERDQLAVELNSRDLEAARFEEDAAGHQLQQAKAALLQVRRDARNGKPGVRQWEIRSPVAGRVLRVAQESEAVVSIGTPLLELGEPADLEVVVDVLTSDAVLIPQGAEVRLVHYGAAEPLAGRVRRIEPSGFTKISALGVEEQRVNVLIDIVSPRSQWQSLGDAYRVDARIVVFARDEAIKVPASALFREGDSWMVFTVADGVARKRAVQIARRGGVEAMVKSGLQPGERVVVYPGDRVSDGARIQPR